MFEFRFPDSQTQHSLTRICVSIVIFKMECFLTFSRCNPKAFDFVSVGSRWVSFFASSFYPCCLWATFSPALVLLCWAWMLLSAVLLAGLIPWCSSSICLDILILNLSCILLCFLFSVFSPHSFYSFLL